MYKLAKIAVFRQPSFSPVFGGTKVPPPNVLCLKLNGSDPLPTDYELRWLFVRGQSMDNPSNYNQDCGGKLTNIDDNNRSD